MITGLTQSEPLGKKIHPRAQGQKPRTLPPSTERFALVAAAATAIADAADQPL